MSNPPADIWPWIIVAALGVYHGINPAMGWLFAVALGLHRGSQRVVAVSLVPIALGHLASTALMVAAFLLLGRMVDRAVLVRVAAGFLIVWAIWHALYGHRRRPLVGMQTGLLGLAAWSFVMASAHGAGLMLLPALLPLCAPSAQLTDAAVLPALAALGLHAAAMLATIALISLAVYHWIGVAFLRRGWINLDLVWTAALLVCGVILLV